MMTTQRRVCEGPCTLPCDEFKNTLKVYRLNCSSLTSSTASARLARVTKCAATPWSSRPDPLGSGWHHRLRPDPASLQPSRRTASMTQSLGGSHGTALQCVRGPPQPSPLPSDSSFAPFRAPPSPSLNLPVQVPRQRIARAELIGGSNVGGPRSVS